MRIYLIGFMGSGKSVIGRKLANMIKFGFLDIDEEFERKYKISIDNFFTKYSEQEFRQMESKLLIDTKNLENYVISTGGGTPCYNDNISLIKKNGVSVYLKVSAAVLVQRLSSSHKARPVLQGKTQAELETHITELLKMREPFYSRADYIVDEEHIDLHLLQRVLFP